MSGVQYPIGAAAKLTGIGLDRLRAWERRYGAVVPEYGVRGRLYSEGHIQRLVLLRELVDRGHAIGQVARLADEQLRGLLGVAAVTSDPSAHARPALGTLVEAVERLDYSETDRLLSRSAALLAPRDLVYLVALPLIQAIGTGWHEGRFTIAQEHMVSAALRSLLGNLLRLHSPGKPGVSLLLATPASEPHEFGILAAALLAAGAGLGVVYLGPDLPSREIADASRRCGARVIVLGIAGERISKATREEIVQVARQKPPSAELWVGGPARSLEALAADGVVLLRDFEVYERHLRRLGAIV
jgi:DNA-binding transcriptional MerR regulator/methylmalonyl-CoA mutase cobalamin-binding subunit